jgi:ribosomal protein L9
MLRQKWSDRSKRLRALGSTVSSFEKRAAQDKVQQRLLEKEQKTKQIADKKAEAAKRAGERGPHHGAVGHHEYTQSCYTEFW